VNDCFLRDAPTIVLVMRDSLDPEWIADAIGALQQPGSAVIIRGEHERFCSGLPLERAGSGGFDVIAAVSALSVLLQCLSADSRPVVAVVRGDALGGGVGLLAVADVVISSPDARFQLPEVFFGLVPSAVLPFIARRVGWGVARRMALGEPALTAEEALRLGLVDVISPTPERDLEVRLERWRRADPNALASVRRLAAIGWPANEALATFADLWATSAQARIRRFVDGDPPWEGGEQ
jgi:enoyl-CoA hydratase/carnithine racemase